MATAYVFLKTKGAAQGTDTNATMLGDIVTILPVHPTDWRKSIGGKDLNFFLPIIVNDLNIPCGDGVADAAGTFTIGARGIEFECIRCPYNDMDDCDLIKYSKATWTAGDVLNPPKIAKARWHWIDIASLGLSNPIKNLLSNTNKTAQQMEQIMTYISTRPKSKSLVIAKATS